MDILPKNGSKRSLLPEIGAQTFCYIPGRGYPLCTAYSIDITLKEKNSQLSRAITYHHPLPPNPGILANLAHKSEYMGEIALDVQGVFFNWSHPEKF